MRSSGRAAALDALTRSSWRRFGRRVDLSGDHAWLQAPVAHTPLVADSWAQAVAVELGGRVVRDPGEHGLLAAVSDLDGPRFDARLLDPLVRDFYEHTSAWRMDVWSRWQAPFRLPGEAVLRLWGRRVQQLAIPVDPLAVAHGIDSRVLPVLDAAGRQVWACWLRRLRGSGDVLFSGAYRVAELPGHGRVVHVAFPLEEGNVQVFLRPTVTPAGGLVLSSPAGPFGAPGAYVVVVGADAPEGGAAWGSRAPVHETFHVYRAPEDPEPGVVRCDHELRIGPWVAVRLHYRMTAKAGGVSRG